MTAAPSLVLALDAASPLVSVALGRGGRVLAARAEPISRSSRRLLEMVAEVLAEAGVELARVEGLAALRGPGSFTGLRIALATALGLQMALDLPATALPTLQALATFAPPDAPVAVGAVDALRGEWTVERFVPGPFPRSLGEPALLPAREIGRLAPAALVGFGVSALPAAPGVAAVEPGPLAPAALALLAAAPPGAVAWDPELLTSPIYARPPAVTPPRAARAVPATPATPSSTGAAEGRR